VVELSESIELVTNIVLVVDEIGVVVLVVGEVVVVVVVVGFSVTLVVVVVGVGEVFF
jgi:hypothetical protein